MSFMAPQKTIPSQRLALLRTYPLFAHSPDTILKELADLFSDAVFEPDQIIVQQHDLIDSVYLIASGAAEVSCQQDLPQAQESNILAILSEGDAIGLSTAGFYSTTGLHTATVKGIAPLLAIRLDLVDLKQFLSKHERFNENMLKATDSLLRQKFVKQVEPFQQIDPVLLKDLAEQVEELHIPAGEIIIKQGDTADCCYLLVSGSVEIILTKIDGSTVSLDILDEVATLFGETALLTNEKRNATAKAVDECKLYVLKREQFLKLTQSASTSGLLFELMMDRHRPVRAG